MTDTLRNMPRYIRNTDAFGWQGADSPSGPWRSITPPQSGAPWQIATPMDALRQASAEVSGVEVLSPAAHAVRNAAIAAKPGQMIAAALRAAANQMAAWADNDGKIELDDLLAIANELDLPSS